MTPKKDRIALKRFSGVYYRESTTKYWRGRPDRCYWVSFKDSLTKKLRWEKCGWASEAWTPEAAQNMRYELLEENRTGKYKPKQERKKDLLLFGELAIKYIEWAKTNKKSWRDDELRYSKHLEEVFSNTRLKAITPFALEGLKLNLQKKGLAPATVKHVLILIRQMFNKAVSWGLYDGPNPIKQVKLPTINNKRLRFLSQDEANSLLEELSLRSKTTHDIALFSLRTGARFDEVAKLKWQDIDFDNGIIHLEGKNSETRQAYMTDDIKAILESRNSGIPDEHIFKNRKTGGKINKVSHAYRRTIEALGLNEGVTDPSQKVVFHSLRHTFGSWLAMQGTPIYTIKELLGHKTLAMTERYAHLLPDHKREAIEQMVAGLKKGTTLQKASTGGKN